jgi:cellulose synthase/poly-beta-1,6-N-acetylglucosamine synthase-like glycosyltransferase
MDLLGFFRPFLLYACNIGLGAALAVWLIRLVEMLAASVWIKRESTSLRSVDYRRFQESEHIMPVSLILPAVDETESITECVDNLLSLEFKRYELIVVADSANKESWRDLHSKYRLLPFSQPYKKSLKSGRVAAIYRSAADVRLIVLDHQGGSRAEALNAGVNISSYPIAAVTYPMLRLTRDALLKTVYSFVGDPFCVFIGTFPRVGDAGDGAGETKTTLAQEMQSVEQLATLYSNRPGYAELGLYLPLQTTFAAFLKSAVIEAGGFSGDTEAEQADLLLRLHMRMRRDRRKYGVRLLPDAVCFRRPSPSVKDASGDAGGAYAAMRDAIRKNARLARAMPAIRHTRRESAGLPLLGIGFLLVLLVSAALGAVSVWLAVFYLLLSALFGALQSVSAVLLEENAYRPHTDTGLLTKRYRAAFLENFGFRQRVSLARIFAPRR